LKPFRTSRRLEKFEESNVLTNEKIENVASPIMTSHKSLIVWPRATIQEAIKHRITIPVMLATRIFLIPDTPKVRGTKGLPATIDRMKRKKKAPRSKNIGGTLLCKSVYE
jgi:predicted DNA-binding transcriptional regulator AlpA